MVYQGKILKRFEYKHLPKELHYIAAPFHALANDICGHLPVNSEKSECLRKLLEARECAIMAWLLGDDGR